MLPKLSKNEVLRYSRHLLIPEVGLDGQRKLKASSVLVVGSGGLGAPVALYLAAAGIGHIGLVDFDVVDASNLQRQVIHATSRVGMLKVESARQQMLDLNPFIQVDAINAVFQSQNARKIADGYDLIVDGTDNFPTRYLINDLCALTGRPYVYGSIFRFEGQVSVFDARLGPCYRCLFPEPPPPGMTPSCAEGGVFGVLPGTIGTLQATQAIKLLLGIGDQLIGKLMLYDALETSFQTVKLRKNPHCKLCGDHPEIHELIDYEEFCGVPAHDRHITLQDPGVEVLPRELKAELDAGKPVVLVDVREPVESQISSIPGSINIPMGMMTTRRAELDQEADIVLYCRSGVRSLQVLQTLRSAGFQHVRSLRGGVNAWVREIDPQQYIY